jgi:hypothetical protein
LNSSLAVEVACEDVIADSSALPLAVEVTCEDVVAESSALPPVACEAVELQSDIVILLATPPTIVDASVAVVRSLNPPAVALVLQASSVVESFEAKPPDLAALEVGPKGAALMWSYQSAWLAAKNRGWTKLPLPLLVIASPARWS